MKKGTQPKSGKRRNYFEFDLNSPVKYLQTPPRKHSKPRQFPPSAPNMTAQIRREVNEVKRRVDKTEKVIKHIDRQRNSPTKIVPSDAIELSFCFDKRNSVQKVRLLSERSKDQGTKNGKVESDQSPQSSIKEEEKFRVPKHNRTSRLHQSRQKDGTNYLLIDTDCPQISDRMDHERLNSTDYRRQSQRKPIFDSPRKEPIGTYKLRHIREKQLSKSKQTISPRLFKPLDVNSGRKHVQNYMNRSRDTIRSIYLMEALSLSQSRERSARNNSNQNSSKVTFKKNNPKINLPQSPLSPKTKIYNIRPRFQFELPPPSPRTHQSSHVSYYEEQDPLWVDLRADLRKEEVVNRYLSDSDMNSIFEYLKKSHIRPSKWKPFVIDEAKRCKKQNKHCL